MTQSNDDNCNCTEATTYDGLVNNVPSELEYMLTQEQREAVTRKGIADGC